MKNVTEFATASKILPSPSLAVNTSGKKLALAASRSSTIARSSSATAATSSFFSPSSDQHDNQEYNYMVKISSLQRAVGFFFMLWLSSDSDRGQTVQEVVSV